MCNKPIFSLRKAVFLEMRARCHPSLTLGYYYLLTGYRELQHIKLACGPTFLLNKIVPQFTTLLFDITTLSAWDTLIDSTVKSE